MSTSKPKSKLKKARAIALEAGVGVAATLGLAALCGVPQFGLALLDPHPVWLVVVVIAARYGTRGLAIALIVAWGGLAIANGADGPSRVLDTLAMPIELGALAACVLVAWIVSGNERREQALEGKVVDLERRASVDASTIGELRRAALALRARNDRLDLSLTFLRNVARRLHGSDVEAAAQAALELIGARLGARAASVEILAGGELVPLAVIGIWNQKRPITRRSRRCGRASRRARWSSPKADRTIATSRRPSPTRRARSAASSRRAVYPAAARAWRRFAISR